MQLDQTMIQSGKMRLLNITGKLLTSKNYSNLDTIEFQVLESAGIYFIELETQNTVSERLKVVKM